MDWDRIEGNWKQMSGKVKEKWGDFTDDEITISADLYEVLLAYQYYRRPSA